MRGRYVSPDVAEAERYFLVHVMRWKFERSFNVAPTQQVPVVRIADGEREGVTLRWGLVPFFAKGILPKYSTINATIEKLSDGPCWRGPWKRGERCILPATGFYEWHVNTDGSKAPSARPLRTQIATAAMPYRHVRKSLDRHPRASSSVPIRCWRRDGWHTSPPQINEANRSTSLSAENCRCRPRGSFWFRPLSSQHSEDIVDGGIGNKKALRGMVTRRDRECKQRLLLGGIAAQGRGSAAATFSNVCSASSCQKECKSATARLKSALTCGLHEVSNDTAPRYSGMGISAIPSCP